MSGGSTLVEALIGLVLVAIVITIFFTLITFVFTATKLTEDTTRLYSFLTFVQDYLSRFRVGNVLDTTFLRSKINELFWGSSNPKKYPLIESLSQEEVVLRNGVIYRRVIAKIRVSENKIVEKVFLIGF